MNIEKITKEALLTFFLETSEPYIGGLTAMDVCNIGRWVSRIWEADVYSMRTHLLLLHQMIRAGHLQPPYNAEPDYAPVVQFQPVSMFNNDGPPTVPQLLRLMLQKLRLQGPPATTAAAVATTSSQCQLPTPCCPKPLTKSRIPIRSQSQPRADSQTNDDRQRTRSAERCMMPGVGYCQQYACTPEDDYPYRAGTSTPLRGSFHRPCFPLSPIRGTSRPGRSRIPSSDQWLSNSQNFSFNQTYPKGRTKSTSDLWYNQENNSHSKNILPSCCYHLDRLKTVRTATKQ